MLNLGALSRVALSSITSWHDESYGDVEAFVGASYFGSALVVKQGPRTFGRVLLRQPPVVANMTPAETDEQLKLARAACGVLVVGGVSPKRDARPESGGAT